MSTDAEAILRKIADSQAFIGLGRNRWSDNGSGSLLIDGSVDLTSEECDYLEGLGFTYWQRTRRATE